MAVKACKCLPHKKLRALLEIVVRYSGSIGNENSKSGKVKVLVSQSCPTLRDPIDGSLPGSPVPGILQSRILEWVAISFSNA